MEYGIRTLNMYILMYSQRNKHSKCCYIVCYIPSHTFIHSLTHSVSHSLRACFDHIYPDVGCIKIHSMVIRKREKQKSKTMQKLTYNYNNIFTRSEET